MGDVILFPERRVARSEEPTSVVGAALNAAHADTGDEWLDRLGTAIALSPPYESGDGALCAVVPIRNR